MRGTDQDAIALARLDRIEAHIRRDAVEPGSERNRSAERLAALPGAAKGFLDCILGFVDRVQHPVAVDKQLVPIDGNIVTERLGGEHSCIVSVPVNAHLEEGFAA